MSHAFDSGYAKPQRTLIQQGAIALLSGLKRPTGYLVAVIPWGSIVRTYTDEIGIAQLVDSLGGRAPSVAIATGARSFKPVGIGGFNAVSEIELLVYFASSNARNQQIGRQEMDVAAAASDTADPGLHVMMEHVAELLVGQRLEPRTPPPPPPPAASVGGYLGGYLGEPRPTVRRLGVQPPGSGAGAVKQVRPEREDELCTTPAVTIWLQTYLVTVNTIISEWRTVDQLLDSIRTRVALDLDEVHLPAAATDSATIDVYDDDLSGAT